MADLTPKTINELTESASMSNSDVFAINSSGSAKKVQWQTMNNGVASSANPLAVSRGGTGANTAAGAMAALGNADYIVHQGETTVNGVAWEWRQYASGFAEAFATVVHTGLSYSAWGSGYYANLDPVALPTGLFSSADGMTASMISGNDAWLGSPSTTSPSHDLTVATAPSLMVLRFGTSSSASATVSYHVWGAWSA